MTKDALNYFGGFYQVCNASATAFACDIPNYYTKTCGCKEGYTPSLVARGFTVPTSACPDLFYGVGYSSTYLCSNESVVEEEISIMGGTYGVQNGQCLGDIDNIYTKTTDCPTGFTAYESSIECCSWNSKNGCQASRTTYTCLNNIYPV